MNLCVFIVGCNACSNYLDALLFYHSFRAIFNNRAHLELARNKYKRCECRALFIGSRFIFTDAVELFAGTVNYFIYP